VALLLDTHAYLWWLSEDPKLSARAAAAISIGEETVFVSAASVWEIATKHRLGKLPLPDALRGDMEEALTIDGFLGLPVNLAHAQRAGALPGPHADPFDRMLLAQAMVEDLTLISNEQPFDLYGVRRLW